MRRSLLATLVSASVIAATSVPAAADPPDHSTGAVTYSVIGDTPYGAPQIQNFPNDIAEINSDPDVTLVVHLGDIKNGSSRCDQADSNPATGDFTQIRDNFTGFQDPLVYTPGDNEWTDCHRANNGSYWPAGPIPPGEWPGRSGPPRLDLIRQMFFPVPGQTLGGLPRAVSYQDDFVENVAWMQSSVEFATVNVSGSNNDWLAWFDPTQGTNPADDPDPLRTQAQIDEVHKRTAGDLRWLKHVFNQATAHRAAAVVIGLQADMWDPAFAGDPVQSDHYTPLVQALATHALAFGKPVYLFNGDSHAFTVDHPLADVTTAQNHDVYGLTEPVPNLERDVCALSALLGGGD